MRAVLFLSVTYAVDGFTKLDRSKTGFFYFLFFLVFLVMDIVELAQ